MGLGIRIQLTRMPAMGIHMPVGHTLTPIPAVIPTPTVSLRMQDIGAADTVGDTGPIIGGTAIERGTGTAIEVAMAIAADMGTVAAMALARGTGIEADLAVTVVAVMRQAMAGQADSVAGTRASLAVMAAGMAAATANVSTGRF